MSMVDTIAAYLRDAGWTQTTTGQWVNPRPKLYRTHSRKGIRRDEPMTMTQAVSEQIRWETLRAVDGAWHDPHDDGSVRPPVR